MKSELQKERSPEGGIYFDDGVLEVGKAIRSITPDVINDGETCSQTLIDAMAYIEEVEQKKEARIVYRELDTYQNNKTGEIYLKGVEVINATNAQDGQRMVLYMDGLGGHFVREEAEFYDKFTAVEDPT